MVPIKFKSGHELVRLGDEEREKLQNLFNKINSEFVQLNPGGWRLLMSFAEYADQIYDFKLDTSDVMIMSFPKSGTNWLSEIVWSMRNFSLIDTEITSQTLFARVPGFVIDFIWKNDRKAMSDMVSAICPEIDKDGPPLLQLANLTPKPRTLRTHLPFSLNPPNTLDTCKVIFVARNPKDACISMLHYQKLVKSFYFNGDLDQFIDVFVKDQTVFGPFWGFSKEAWERRNHPNLHWIYFEDMKTDIYQEIVRLNEFLGTKLTEAQMKKVVEHTQFKNMKKRDPVFGTFKKGEENELTNKEGSFFRKGDAGGWRNTLTPAQDKKFNDWIEKNSKDTDLKFKY